MKTKIEVIVFLSVVCIVGIVLSLFMHELFDLAIAANLSWDTIYLLYPFVVNGIPILAALTINIFRRSHAPMNISKLRRPDIKPLAISSVVGMLILLGVTSSISTIFKIPSPEPYMDNILLIFILAGVLVPILEEILFRGIIQSELTRIFNPWIAIVISAAIFGVAHTGVFQSSYAFFGGLFIGWVYYKTKNLTYPIIIHMCCNLSTLTLGYLERYFHWKASSYSAIFILIVSLIAIPILIRYLHRYWRRAGISDNPTPKTPLALESESEP